MAVGAGLAFPAWGLVGLVLASFLGLSPFVALVSAASLVGVQIVLARRARHADPPKARPLSRTFLVYLLAFVVFFCAFFAQAAYEHDGGIATGEWNSLGDLGLHVAIVAGFVKGENFPPEHPDFADARLTYPFLCDFIAALFVTSGVPLTRALFLENVLLSVVLLALLYRWTLQLTQDRVAAYLLPVLLFFSGGLGFLTLVDEARESGRSVFQALMHPSHAVTILWGSWGDVLRWGNSLTTFFLPQRAWLVGLPLALIAWTAWWQAIGAGQATATRRRMMLAGLATGLLPLAHTYTFLVLMSMGACLALLFWRLWRGWVYYFAVSLSLALPQLAWISRDAAAHTGRFVAWHYGWANPPELGLNLAQYWVVNAGLTLPLAVLALAWRGPNAYVPSRLMRFLAPFALCLIAPHFVRLSPWDWDTNKVLFFGYLALLIPVALLLSRMLRGTALAKAMGAVTLVLLTLSGGIDVWRVVSGREVWMQFDANAMAQARLIEERTPPRARVLSAFASGRAALLTGRRSLVGHPWTMWSHGIDAEARLADMRRIFGGAPDADGLIERYRIDYVLIGPLERGELTIDDGYFERFEKVGEAGGATLYKVRRG